MRLARCLMAMMLAAAAAVAGAQGWSPQKNVWADAFLAGEAFRKDLDQDYAEMRSVLSDLGLAM